MDMESFQQTKNKYIAMIEMLRGIAEEFGADKEIEQLEKLAMIIRQEGAEIAESSDFETEEELERKLWELLSNDKRKINHLAGAMLLNCLEPHLITAVMNGDDMEDKLKLINPKFVNARKSLAAQLLSEKQKLNRQVVKCVMSYEANYHIMLRRMREDLMKYRGLVDVKLLENEISVIVSRQEKWCLRRMKEDMQGLEKEFIAFTKDIMQTKKKFRQDIIHIMNNNLFNIIAKKTENALDIIKYAPGMEEFEDIENALEAVQEDIFNISNSKFWIDRELMNWKNNLDVHGEEEPDATQVLIKIGQNVQQEYIRQEANSKRIYNDFLKKYIANSIEALQNETLAYIDALQNQLFEDLDNRKEEKDVCRSKLEHLVSARNQIVHALEENPAGVLITD